MMIVAGGRRVWVWGVSRNTTTLRRWVLIIMSIIVVYLTWLLYYYPFSSFPFLRAN